MSNYGRHFEFRVPPRPTNRAGRYITGATRIWIGAPIKVVDDAVADANGRLEVGLATGATVPRKGIHGIMVYEYAFSGYAGVDRALTTPSDMGLAPANAPVQLVNGDDVKVVLRNVAASTFLGGKQIEAMTFVAGVGATPTVAVDDLLTPGTGNVNDGFWAETANPDEAWLVVTGVDTTRGEVEARMTF